MAVQYQEQRSMQIETYRDNNNKQKIYTTHNKYMNI